jgi:hypothetical protein
LKNRVASSGTWQYAAKDNTTSQLLISTTNMKMPTQTQTTIKTLRFNSNIINSKLTYLLTNTADDVDESSWTANGERRQLDGVTNNTAEGVDENFQSAQPQKKTFIISN